MVAVGEPMSATEEGGNVSTAITADRDLGESLGRSFLEEGLERVRGIRVGAGVVTEGAVIEVTELKDVSVICGIGAKLGISI